ncbi:MAG: DUF11 domain-containing protein [Planctomycetota bacterium]|nr:DUF11 domain-containing protein [Planctomycetota bacterium]
MESTTIARQVDLMVEKVDDVDPVIAGNTATYTVTVTNLGPSDASGVELTENLSIPTEASVTSITPSAGTYAPALSPTGVWSLGALAAGANATLTVVVAVDSSAADGDNLANSITITDSTEPDSDGSNNMDSETTNIDRQYDLVVTKVDNVDPVLAGNSVAYTVTITNNGPSDASGIALTENLTLPSGASVNSITPSGMTSYSDPTWTVGDLPAGASETLIIVLDVASSASDADMISNTATLSAFAETDTNNANDSATETTDIDRQIDLTLMKDDSADPVLAGDTLIYTVTLTNNGPSDATDIEVAENLVLPVSGTTLVSIVPSSGSYGTSSTDPMGTWTLPSLAAGAMETLTVTIDVDFTAANGLTVTNTASVTAVDETRINLGDDSDTEVTTIRRSIDLTVTKMGDNSMPFVGETVTFTLTVSNAGPHDATSVALTDVLPAQLDFVSASGDGTYTSASGVWNVGTLASGATAMLTIVTTVIGAGDFTNTAAVATVNELDANLGDNSSSVMLSAELLIDPGLKIESVRYTLNPETIADDDTLSVRGKVELASLESAGQPLASLGSAAFELDFGGALFEFPAPASASSSQVVWVSPVSETFRARASLNRRTGAFTFSATRAGLSVLGIDFPPQLNEPNDIPVSLTIGAFTATATLTTTYTHRTMAGSGVGQFRYGSSLHELPDGILFADSVKILQRRLGNQFIQQRALLTLCYRTVGGGPVDPAVAGATLIVGPFAETVGNDPTVDAEFVPVSGGAAHRYVRPARNLDGTPVPALNFAKVEFQHALWRITAATHWMPEGTFGTPTATTPIAQPLAVLLPITVYVAPNASVGTTVLLRRQGNSYLKP